MMKKEIREIDERLREVDEGLGKLFDYIRKDGRCKDPNWKRNEAIGPLSEDPLKYNMTDAEEKLYMGLLEFSLQLMRTRKNLI